MNELEKIVNEVQYRTGKSLAEIGKGIHYTRSHFTREIKLGTNEKIKDLLTEKYKQYLIDYLAIESNSVLEEPESKYALQNDDRIIEMLASKQRTIELLARQVQVMQSKITDLETG
jgi:uncharacterized coiled-coil protein SlyX